MKRFLFFITTCMIVVPAMAQADIANATRIMKGLQQNYTMHPLSFDVKYLYSNEHTPEKVLDSLKGKMEFNGTNYRCLLDSTETIHNSKYNIILFKEDKIMYLATAATQTAAQDPLASMQKIMEKSGITGCTVSSDKGKTLIRFDFAAGGSCKQMRIVVDTVKQQLLSMQYIIKTALLKETQDSTDNTEMEGYEEYALVSTSYYNYSDLQPDSKRFDESTFFYKENAEFKVKPAYEDYKIFIATPNL